MTFWFFGCIIVLRNKEIDKFLGADKMNTKEFDALEANKDFQETAYALKVAQTTSAIELELLRKEIKEEKQQS